MIQYEGIFRLPDNKNIRATEESGYILLLPQLKKDRMDIDCLVYPTLEAMDVPNASIASFRVNDLLYHRYIALVPNGKKKDRVELNFHKQVFTEGVLTRVCIDHGKNEEFFMHKDGDKYISANEKEIITVKREPILPVDNNGKDVVEKTLMLAHQLLMAYFKKKYVQDLTEGTVKFSVIKVPEK